MSLNTLISLFLSLNLSLIASYFGFLALKKIRPYLQLTHKTFLRVIQFVFVISILASLLIPLIPQSSDKTSTVISKVEKVRLPRPAVEQALNAELGEAISFQAGEEYSASLGARESFSVAFLVLGLIVASIFWALYLFVFELKKMRRILSEAFVHHRCGRVSVLLSDSVSVPFSTWHFNKAIVVLPMIMLERSRDLLIATQHELQHHRQYDTQWVFLSQFLGVMFKLNPFFKKWLSEISELQELACDEVLLKRGQSILSSYADVLIRAIESSRKESPAPALAAGFLGGRRKRRQFKFFAYRLAEIKNRRGGSTMTLVTTLIGAIAYVGSVAWMSTISPEVHAKQRVEARYNKEVQEIATQELRAALKKMKSAVSAFAIVENPMTGEILAAVQVDGRDGTVKQDALFLSKPFEPMSLMKPIYIGAALEEGVTNMKQKYNCEKGSYVVDDRVYHDWKAFEELSPAEAIANSSSICALKAVEKLGAKKLRNAAIKMGFGPDGAKMAYPKSAHGFVRNFDQNTEKTFVAQMAYGFSAQYVTPLELTQAYGAIANGGQLFKAVSYGAKPEKLGTAFKSKTAEELRQALRLAVVKGTGKSAEIKHFQPGGKTATSPSSYDVGRGSFIGFAPYDKPKLLVYVAVHRSDLSNTSGSGFAAPIFKNIMKRSLKLLGADAVAVK